MFSQRTPSPFQKRKSQDNELSYAERISVNQLTTLRSTVDEDLKSYAAMSIAGIGLSCRTLYDTLPNQLIQDIRQSGLQVSSLGWIGAFTGFNGHPRCQAVQEAKQTIKLAARLGCRVVTVLSGPQAGHITSHARRLLVESLQTLLPLAESCGVDLALMPMHPKFEDQWSFLTTLAEVQAIIKQVGHRRLGLCFSTYHSCHESGLVDRLASLARDIKLVQVADWAREPRCANSRAMPGEGILRLPEMIQALEQAGYRGWYELDVWCRENWKRDQEEVLREGVNAMLELGALLDVPS